MVRFIGVAEFPEEIFDTLDIVFQQNRLTDTTNLMNELKVQYEMGAISKQTIIDISPYSVDTALEIQRIESEKSGAE